MPESLVEPLHDNKSQPLTNGAANAASDAPAQRSLRDVCNDAQRKVAAFLSEPDPGSEILRAVQRQVRISLDVVDKALEEYGYGRRSTLFLHHTCRFAQHQEHSSGYQDSQLTNTISRYQNPRTLPLLQWRQRLPRHADPDPRLPPTTL